MRRAEFLDLDKEMVKIHPVAKADPENITIEWNGEEIDHNRVAVVDKVDMSELGVHEEGYSIISHREVLKALREVVGDTIHGKVVEYAGGRRMSTYLYPPKWREDVSSESDIIQFGLKISNSYDGSSALKLDVVGLRLICENGMVVPKTQNKSYHKHTSDRLDEFKEELKEMIGMDVEEVLEIYREARDLEVDVEDTIEALKLPNSLQEEVIEELKYERETAWDVYNKITEKITHGYGDSEGVSEISEGYANRLHEQANRVLQPDEVKELAEA